MNRNITIKPEVAKQFKKAMDSGQAVCSARHAEWASLPQHTRCLRDAECWRFRQENRSFEYPNLTEAGMFFL